MIIIVNARKKEWSGNRIRYSEVIKLGISIPNPGKYNPSVTFFKADQDPSQGIFNRRTSVKIKEGTCFNVHITGNS
jgi:hypothetical protein